MLSLRPLAFWVLLVIFFSFLSMRTSVATNAMDEFTIFNFTNVENLDNWEELSDVVRKGGMSKAAFVLQQSNEFKRAVFFTLLNPQPNGAGFAGVRTNTKMDLRMYKELAILMRGQGQNSGYKVVLRHKGLNDEPHPSYEQMFEAPMEGQFSVVKLPLDKFEPYIRGRKQDPAVAGELDLSAITKFGFQIYGGVFLPVKQSGASSLEVDWVKAV